MTVTGVVIEHGEGRFFVPASQAVVALADPRISAVPGSSFAMLWYAGHVVPVLGWAGVTPPSSGLPRTTALMCEVDGQTVGLAHVEVLRSGAFEAAGAGVVHEGASIPRLDLRGLLAAAVGSGKAVERGVRG